MTQWYNQDLVRGGRPSSSLLAYFYFTLSQLVKLLIINVVMLCMATNLLAIGEGGGAGELDVPPPNKEETLAFQ